MTSVAPRVLVEPSNAFLFNIGDMAMLDMAIKRLSDRLPESDIQVVTWEPAEFERLGARGVPLEADARNVWLELIPQKVACALPIGWSVGLRQIATGALLPLIRKAPGKAGGVAAKIGCFLDAVRRADALIVTGMGAITDSFPRPAYEVLETMALAMSFGCRVFMVGQGIGPIESPGLRGRAAAVLPKVELIGVREKRTSVPILRDLGVAPDRIVVTGDDALELGHELRAPERGNAIGVNFRVADYAAIGRKDAGAIAQVVREEGRLRKAPLVALPVSHERADADARELGATLPELASHLEQEGPIHTPADLARQTRRCRLVVAGSYHAAVFALSMGIPAIGLARSAYYLGKFAGLADMFGNGCAWVDLNKGDAVSVLRRSIARMWDEGDALGGEILRATEAQIELGRGLYTRIAEALRPLNGDA